MNETGLKERYTDKDIPCFVFRRNFPEKLRILQGIGTNSEFLFISFCPLQIRDYYDRHEGLMERNLADRERILQQMRDRVLLDEDELHQNLAQRDGLRRKLQNAGRLNRLYRSR